MSLTMVSRGTAGQPMLAARLRHPAQVAHPVPGQRVAIDGLIDARNVAEVRAALREAMDHGVGELVVDVGGLELGDATGLGALLGAHRRASRCGRTLVLESVQPTLQRILNYTRLSRVFAVRASTADAGRLLG